MRLRPWLPFLSVVLQVLLAFLVALWIDGSDLPQPVGSWGYVFGVVMATVIYLSVPGLLLLACGIAGSFAPTTVGVRTATIVGAVVAALVGVAGLVVGLPELAGADSRAEEFFAIGLLAASVIPLLPLLVAFRRVEAPVAATSHPT